MSKSVQIHIPQPCHENWQNMTPKEQGRFCGSCRKIVVDFTTMSDKELLDHISNAAGQHTCGRFYNDQLNRNISAPKNRRRFSWAYVWNLLLVTFLATESYAQGEPVIRKKTEVQLPDVTPRVGTFAVREPDTIASKEISGIVMDDKSRAPLAGATVMVKGTSKGMVTDEKGRFKLMIDDKGTATLEITYVGYEPQTVVLKNKKKANKIKVRMVESDVVIAGAIVITKEEN